MAAALRPAPVAGILGSLLGAGRHRLLYLAVLVGGRYRTASRKATADMRTRMADPSASPRSRTPICQRAPPAVLAAPDGTLPGDTHLYPGARGHEPRAGARRISRLRARSNHSSREQGIGHDHGHEQDPRMSALP